MSSISTRQFVYMLPWMQFWCLLVLFVSTPALSGTASTATASVDLKSFLQLDEKIKQYLIDISKGLKAPATGPSQAMLDGPGPTFSATMFSFSGLLIRDGAARCSGTLVAPDIFLTAAHCVCENPSSPSNPSSNPYPDAQSCLSGGAPSAHPTKVFFPSYGEFETDGAPVIHPSYHLFDVTEDQVASHDYYKGAIADLAIVHLQKHVTDYLPTLAASQLPAPIFFGFGSTQISGDEKTNKIPPGRYDYFPVAVFSAPLDQCIEGVPDMLCQHYDALSNTGPPQSLICEGDSGGAMFALPDDDSPPVITGIASGMLYNNKCVPHSAYGVLTNIVPYVSWIETLKAQLSKPAPKVSSPTCADGFIPIRGAVKISVSGLGSTSTLTIFQSQQVTSLSAEEAMSCNSLYHRKEITSCNPTADTVTLNATGFGGVQIVLCKKT